YVQYACARIASIKRKAAESGIEIDLSKADWSKLSSPAEKALAVTASFYGNTLRTAAERRDASVLVEYLLNLAKSFNRFYRECPVMTAESDELRLARLAACETARQILTDGLNTLTIEVPSAM
ncbi:MAG: DALR anticodon-binding domain-containing protein, partial [Victivallaceae bacterium]